MAHYFWTQNSLPNDTKLEMDSTQSELKSKLDSEVELDLLEQKLDLVKVKLWRWKVAAVAFAGFAVLLTSTIILFGRAHCGIAAL